MIGRLVRLLVSVARTLVVVAMAVALGAGLAFAISNVSKRHRQAPPVVGSWRELRPPNFD